MSKKPGKSRMGRPPLAAAKRRSKCVLVRLTEAQYRRLLGQAKERGMPMGTLLRELWQADTKEN